MRHKYSLPRARTILFLAPAFAAACTVPPPAVRCISYSAMVAELAPRTLGQSFAESSLASAELRQLEESPEEPPLRCAEFAWVHVATTFKDLTVAKRTGAVTVCAYPLCQTPFAPHVFVHILCAHASPVARVQIWLNEQAARSAGDLEMTGFLGAAIINDFADGLCESTAELVDAIEEAQLAAIAKAAEEDARAEREHLASLAEEEANAPVQWDAVADIRAEEEAMSIFAKPAPEGDGGISWAEVTAASKGKAKNGEKEGRRAQRFCTACGAQMPAEANFCGECGSKRT